MRRVAVLTISMLAVSLALAGFTVPQQAGPFNSTVMYNDPNDVNGSFTFNYAGPQFIPGALTFSGLLTNVNTGSYLTEARWYITNPAGQSALFQPIGSGTTWTGTYTVNPVTATGAQNIFTGNNVGTWTFQAYESYNDTGLDAYWNDVNFSFSDYVPLNYLWKETFEAGIPSTWTNTGSGLQWTTSDVTGRTNYTGGTGYCAIADEDFYNLYPYDTALITPSWVVPAQNATLDFDAAYNDIDAQDYADVDITTDGGATWVNLLRWTTDHSASGPGEHVSLDLAGYAGQTVQARFRYYGDTWDWWFEVDNVGPTGIPEPASLVLLALAGLALRRR